MDRLYKKLESYGDSDYYGFHMPGHKRNLDITGAKLPYKIDITEIDGFDNLHHAEEILEEAQTRAASLYHAGETHYVINGSTGGILSAVMGCTQRGGKILMARNCHKSVYHAVFLNELHPVYLYPEFYEEMELNGEIYPQDVEKLLEAHPDVQAVVITSPTYDGVLSDIKQISEIVHKKKIPLIVDEAHGAHFGFHSYFPENANLKGADVVVHSLHKTLPALTQTALIHINGEFVNRRKIRQYLHMFQTSSPSYVLMASMDECIRLIQERGNEIFEEYTKLLEMTRKCLKELQNMKLVESEEYDKSKIVISVKGTRLEKEDGKFERFTGKKLYDILLREYHLQMEMAAGSYIIAMTSPADTKEGMERLIKALFEIDARLHVFTQEETIAKGALQPPKQEQIYTSYEMEQLREEAEQKRIKRLSWKDAVEMISMEYAYLYPPGIPLIVPGERISEKAIQILRDYEKMGFGIEGINVDKQIEVWINE